MLSPEPPAVLEVRNKEGRVQSICDTLQACLDKRSITSHEADSIRGRVQHASGQLFDRAGRILTALLLDCAQSHDKKLSTEAFTIALELMATLREAGPRVLLRDSPLPNVLVFTDGAYEEGKCSCGAIMFDLSSGVVEHFGLVIKLL